MGKQRVASIWWLVVILLCMASCRFNRLRVYEPYLDSYATGQKEVAKLLEEGVDSVLVYYDGCIGCVHGVPKPYYVYWKEDEQWQITKFSSYGPHNVLKSNLSMGHFQLIKEGLDEELKPSNQYWSHYPYEQVKMYAAGDSICYEVEYMERAKNTSHPKVLWMDKIRSDLLSYEGYWRNKKIKYSGERIHRDSILKWSN